MTLPQVEGLVLTLVGKRRVSVTELTHFEPEDRSTGIFGNYIEVKATDDRIYVLDDGLGWVHEHNETSNDVNWNTIVGTFDNSKVWPSQDKPITVRRLLIELDGRGLTCDKPEQVEEDLELRFGIGLDTELRQA